MELMPCWRAAGALLGVEAALQAVKGHIGILSAGTAGNLGLHHMFSTATQQQFIV